MYRTACHEPFNEFLLNIGVLNFFNIRNFPFRFHCPLEEIYNDFSFECVCSNEGNIEVLMTILIELLVRQYLCHDVKAREASLWF